MSSAAAGSPPAWASADDLEQLARVQLPPSVYDYVAGGSGQELTLAANRAAFERLRLRPRVLTGAENISTQTTLLGMRLAAPLFISPMGRPAHELVHPEGIAGTAGGAADAGIAYMLSANLAATLDVPGEHRICQIYLTTRDESGEVVRRAEAAGYRAICITVDVPVPALRRRNLRHGIEAGRDREAVPAGFANPDLHSAPTWRDVEWLRSTTALPVLIKGIMTGEDARLAIEAGAAGVVVSNHGGRQIDHALGTIDVLPEVVTAVGGRGVVLLDGGVRTSTDVAIAVALGASAVGLGKAAMWALAAGGRRPVAGYIGSLIADLKRTLTFLGASSVAELGPGHVDRRYAPLR